MTTKTYKVKHPPIEFVRWLNKEYRDTETNHFTFIDHYWYYGGDPLRNRVYGCIVKNNEELWSNPQGLISQFLPVQSRE